MPRTYRFDHFTTQKPEVSKLGKEADRERGPLKGHAAWLPEEEGLHYGHAHAQTEELYRKHRQEREQAEREQAEEGPKLKPKVERKAEPKAEHKVERKVERKVEVHVEAAAQPEVKKAQPEVKKAQPEVKKAASPGVRTSQEARPPAEEKPEPLLWELTERTVRGVVGAVRDVVTGHPFAGARRLAEEAVGGARRVVREVSARRRRQRGKAGKRK